MDEKKPLWCPLAAEGHCVPDICAWGQSGECDVTTIAQMYRRPMFMWPQTMEKGHASGVQYNPTASTWDSSLFDAKEEIKALRKDTMHRLNINDYASLPPETTIGEMMDKYRELLSEIARLKREVNEADKWYYHQRDEDFDWMPPYPEVGT